MAKFLLLARDTGSFGALGPDEIQQALERYMAWSDGLAARGHLLSGEKLKDGEGRVLRRASGETVVTDGPFAEVTEVLGGFWLLQADDYDQALALVADSPHLEFGSLELRQVEVME